MANRAICHKDTRVIRKLTTDPLVPLQADEVAVDVPANLDIGGGHWKLDQAGQKVPATQAEARQAGVDREFLDQKKRDQRDELKAAMDELISDPSTPSKFKRLFIAWRLMVR